MYDKVLGNTYYNDEPKVFSDLYYLGRYPYKYPLQKYYFRELDASQLLKLDNYTLLYFLIENQILNISCSIEWFINYLKSNQNI